MYGASNSQAVMGAPAPVQIRQPGSTVLAAQTPARMPRQNGF